MKVLQSIWQSMQQHKKVVVVAAVGIVLAAGYIFWSSFTWQQYENVYVEKSSRAKTDIDAALSAPQSTEEEKAQKTQAIAKVAESYQSLDCHITPMVAWQVFLDSARHKKATCEELAAKLEIVNGAIRNLSQYLKSSQQLVSAMVAEEKPDTVTGDTIEVQVKAWQQVKQKVTSLEADEAFMPVKDKAKEAVGVITDTWDKLFAAHKAQDQTAYEEARAQLSESYDKLATIPPASSAQLTELASQLQAAYDEAF